MKSDLDRLMKEHGVDVLLVNGTTQHNPAMVYFTGVAHVTNADLIKKRGNGTATLFHNPKERDEAEHTGLETISFSKYPFMQLMKETKNNIIDQPALRISAFPRSGIESAKMPSRAK
jgi:spermidine synthase